ncbi:uncharacterized protein [Lepeophtheirus salmonis]|uniref:uncharacterized protein n=1 Tax=Lepeophtheirus salmonis TaxID=72036 RepID=UPI003AF37186
MSSQGISTSKLGLRRCISPASTTLAIKQKYTSEVRENYLPFEAGIRSKIFMESLEYREQRRNAGFKHSKIEWLDEDENRRSHKKNSTTSCSKNKEAPKLEVFYLPETKFQKKRESLRKIYSTRSRKLEMLAIKRKAEEEVFGEKVDGLTSYERNKFLNSRSNLCLSAPSARSMSSSTVAINYHDEESSGSPLTSCFKTSSK